MDGMSIPPERRAPTIHDVAKLSGVSKSSVSNFFHHPNKLSAATRDRVAEAIDSLGFTLNDAARTLRTGRTPVVGYVAFELAAARTPIIANALASRLAERGIDLLLATDRGDASREHAFIDLFARQRVSGLIVSPVGDIEPELRRLRGRGIPSVLMTRHARSAEQAAVTIDHVAGGRLAAEHLLAIGRRRIAFVTDDVRIEQIAARLRGAREVAEAAGAAFEIVACAERTVLGGMAVARELLERTPGQRPDALFCVNDLVAIGVTHGLREHLSIPGDLAVVGYDDIVFATTNAVPLTSIGTPQTELGHAAADLLLAELDVVDAPDRVGPGPSAPARQVEFAPWLVVRDSTAG